MGANQAKGAGVRDQQNRSYKFTGNSSGSNRNSGVSFEQSMESERSNQQLTTPIPSFNAMLLQPAPSDMRMVLYDFTKSMENQISVKRGQYVRFFGFNPSGDWSEVQYPASFPNEAVDDQSLRRGWVPTSYLAAVPEQPIPQPVIPTQAPVPMPPAKKLSSVHTSLPAVPPALQQHSNLLQYAWFHGFVSRQASEHLLRSGITGSYLVRASESAPGELSVTVRNSGRVYHYRIRQDSLGKFYITEMHRFNSVVQLIEHHSNYADGLVCPLQYPAPKRGQQTASDVVRSPSASALDQWEIDRTEIIMRFKLGWGQYGDVYEAVWRRYNTVVAVKTVKREMTSNDFLEEAAIMKHLRHRNLLQMLGVCTREQPYYLVTEFMPNGNMLNYLRNRSVAELTAPVLLHMAVQIAAGMAYLEEHKCVHRDLAARNCLVGERNLIKVADFGLARFVTEDVYTARNGTKFPIKWTAPEGLAYYRFSSKSDVWAFGVVLWELATFGSSPYPGVELHNVYHMLEKGYRMERPHGCPEAVYSIMRRCWAYDAADRPSFAEVLLELERMHSNRNIEAEVARELGTGAALMNAGQLTPAQAEIQQKMQQMQLQHHQQAHQQPQQPGHAMASYNPMSPAIPAPQHARQFSASSQSDRRMMAPYLAELEVKTGQRQVQPMGNHAKHQKQPMYKTTGTNSTTTSCSSGHGGSGGRVTQTAASGGRVRHQAAHHNGHRNGHVHADDEDEDVYFESDLSEEEAGDRRRSGRFLSDEEDEEEEDDDVASFSYRPHVSSRGTASSAEDLLTNSVYQAPAGVTSEETYMLNSIEHIMEKVAVAQRTEETGDVEAVLAAIADVSGQWDSKRELLAPEKASLEERLPKDVDLLPPLLSIEQKLRALRDDLLARQGGEQTAFLGKTLPDSHH